MRLGRAAEDMSLHIWGAWIVMIRNALGLVIHARSQITSANISIAGLVNVLCVNLNRKLKLFSMTCIFTFHKQLH